jgi:hypothetical protein
MGNTDAAANGKSSSHAGCSQAIKQPFQKLKEKLRDTHLHDVKVGIVHEK